MKPWQNTYYFLLDPHSLPSSQRRGGKLGRCPSHLVSKQILLRGNKLIKGKGWYRIGH